jgi:hypothetical protein
VISDVFFAPKCASCFWSQRSAFVLCVAQFLGRKDEKWGLEIATRDVSREIRDAVWAVEMRAACIYVLARAGFSLVAVPRRVLRSSFLVRM